MMVQNTAGGPEPRMQQQVKVVTLFQTPLLSCEDSLPWLKQHKDIHISNHSNWQVNVAC